MFENNCNNKIFCDNTLLYFFEKNVRIYFENAEKADKTTKSRNFKKFEEKNDPIYIIFDEPKLILKDSLHILIMFAIIKMKK